MHYIFKADGGSPGNERGTTAEAADRNELEFIAPRARAGKARPRLSESSLDLHQGLEVGEETDTVPAGLLNDLFKL